jgi:hypothetical protein
MITLTGQQQIAKCTVYRDDVSPTLFYVVPPAPRIALDDNGKPIFSMVWYRRDVSQLTDAERKTKLGGGILTLSSELSPTDAQLKEIRDTLAGDPNIAARARMDKDKLAKALEISGVPITDGSVTIAILGEAGSDPTKPAAPGEFVANMIGVGRVSLTYPERAAFMAKLTQDGAVLLWDLLEKNLPAVRIEYDLKFSHRLDAVSMTVWCEAQKAYHAVKEQWQHLSEDSAFSERHSGGDSAYSYGDDQTDNARNRIFSAITGSDYSGVSITQEAGPDTVKPDEINQLTQQGNELIKDFIAGSFLQYQPGADDTSPGQEPALTTALPSVDGRKYGHDSISQYSLKTVDETMVASLHSFLSEKAVVDGPLTVEDNLANILSGHPVKDFRTQVDIDASFYKYLDVQVVCTADFDQDPVDLVKAHLSYQGRGQQGEINKVDDFLFSKGSPQPQRFSTYLGAPDQLKYKYDCEIFYKDSTSTYKFSGETDETILVLDVDKLGILHVDIQIGVVDWDRIKQVLATLTYGSGSSQKSMQFTFDSQHQAGKWVEIVQPPVTDPYTYTVTYIDKNDQRIDTDPQTSRSKMLVLNQPLQEALKVMIVSAGSFGTDGLIQQIAVALRYQDPDNNYEQSDIVSLAKEGDSKLWTVPLVNKDLRHFDYKVTVFYSGGVTREDDWQTTDADVVPVGDPYGFRVQILPYLLKGGAWAFGTIYLRFDDAQGNIHTEKTLQIQDFATPLTWRFRLGAVDRHTYHYKLTLYRASDGKQVDGPDSEETKEVLVLAPPANP